MTILSAFVETALTIPIDFASPFDDVGEVFLAGGGCVDPFQLEGIPSSLSAPFTVSGGVTPEIPFVLPESFRDEPSRVDLSGGRVSIHSSPFSTLLGRGSAFPLVLPGDSLTRDSPLGLVEQLARDTTMTPASSPQYLLSPALAQGWVEQMLLYLPSISQALSWWKVWVA